jgi:hypothetical protein
VQAGEQESKQERKKESEQVSEQASKQANRQVSKQPKANWHSCKSRRRERSSKLYILRRYKSLDPEFKEVL